MTRSKIEQNYALKMIPRKGFCGKVPQVWNNLFNKKGLKR